MQTKQKTVVILAGPTAVGKTSVGIEMASHYNTEIISADSRQCFKEMNIGVARPSVDELKVPHHFVASHSIHEKVTAASFEEYALAKAEEVFRKNNMIVMVGGTGLYIKAFAEGMDLIPEVPAEVHEEIITAYNENGLAWLQAQVQVLDPLFWEKGEIRNPQRLMRALEVVKATGRSIIEFRKGEKKPRPFSIIKIGLELPKEQLHRNINHRVDKMMQAGLLDEVRYLQPYQHLNALQTVGYKELFSYFKKEIELLPAVEMIKQNTRQYAKRQLTWFRKDPGYAWYPPDAGPILQYLQQKGL